jgi:hypothetical protein
MRSVAIPLAVVAAGAASLPAGAGTEASLVIRPGAGISKLRLGMTEAQVRRAMGKPRFVFTRPTAFGLRSLEYQYGFAEYSVRFFGRRGRLRAVRVGTTLVRERTSNGLGVGSTERAILRAYRALRCQPLRTQPHGSIRTVITVPRECTLFAASGRRTIFTTNVQLKNTWDLITPATWAKRARVIEVSVAAPA